MNGHKFEFEVLDRRGGDRVLLLIYICILCIYTSVAEWLLWLVERLGERNLLVYAAKLLLNPFMLRGALCQDGGAVETTTTENWLELLR